MHKAKQGDVRDLRFKKGRLKNAEAGKYATKRLTKMVVCEHAREKHDRVWCVCILGI